MNLTVEYLFVSGAAGLKHVEFGGWVTCFLCWYIVDTHRWADCHELNPTVVYPLLQCTYINAATVLWWSRPHKCGYVWDRWATIFRERVIRWALEAEETKLKKNSRMHPRDAVFVSPFMPFVFSFEFRLGSWKIEEVPLTDGCFNEVKAYSQEEEPEAGKQWERNYSPSVLYILSELII